MLHSPGSESGSGPATAPMPRERSIKIKLIAQNTKLIHDRLRDVAKDHSELCVTASI